MTYPHLTSVEELKAVLNKHGIEPDKSLGQNFLICEEVVEATVSLVQGGARQVTELGPGVGALTQSLVGAGLLIRAIEKDDDFVEMLPSILPPKMRDNLQIVHGDIKDEDWTWDDSYQIVGNIPYNLSGLIIRRLTQLEKTPEQVVLLVQKEVGERLAAVPTNMNLLGLAVSLWGEAQPVMNVPASCFWPEPKVDSRLMLLTPSSSAPNIKEREAVMKIARVFFQQKRKQVGGVLRRSLNLSEEEAAEIFDKSGISPLARPQEISKDQWLKLTTIIPAL